VKAEGERLLARYRERHRRYHTVTHLAEVLAALDRGAAAMVVEVELAAWWHDAVYDPRAAAGANEAASARLADDVLSRLGATAAMRREVDRLIGLTVTHAVAAGDPAGAALVDADLWILAAPTGRYRRYAAQVRSEYGWLDDETWSVGRSVVLDRFLARPRLFVNDDVQAELGERARHNLAWELATLRAGKPQA
jgi:predicted metal-dependent HD superfamily phosphohydrolase